MQCRSCDRELQAGARFCTTCGTAVPGTSSQMDDSFQALRQWGELDRERSDAPPQPLASYRAPVVAKVMSERTSTLSMLDTLATVFKYLAFASLVLGGIGTIVALASMPRFAISLGSIVTVILLGGLYSALTALSLFVVHVGLRATAAIVVGTAFSVEERAQG